ncbi:MAG: FmdB family zinc ribbon protein [Nocardioides sp.]
MPTYQYACTDCDHAFEQFQSFSDDSLTRCPACEGKLRKVFNAVGVVFKGSGFYRTDSRAASSSNGSDASSKPSPTGTSDSSSSGGTTTTTKSESSSTSSTSSTSDSSGSSPTKTSGSAA